MAFAAFPEGQTTWLKKASRGSELYITAMATYGAVCSVCSSGSQTFKDSVLLSFCLGRCREYIEATGLKLFLLWRRSSTIRAVTVSWSAEPSLEPWPLLFTSSFYFSTGCTLSPSQVRRASPFPCVFSKRGRGLHVCQCRASKQHSEEKCKEVFVLQLLPLSFSCLDWPTQCSSSHMEVPRGRVVRGENTFPPTSTSLLEKVFGNLKACWLCLFQWWNNCTTDQEHTLPGLPLQRGNPILHTL